MILQLDSIVKKKGKNSILHGVSVQIPQSSFFVLMGPTGSGKTTLLRVAGLMDKPDSGSIVFQGKPVPGNRRELLKTRRKMAIMFQNPVMFRGTVRSNIAWGLGIRGVSGREAAIRIDKALELVGLGDFAERNASTLSGGELRRAALARVLVLEPDLLIMDEPTTSLHPSFKTDLLRRIKEIHAETGSTFLIATHDFTDALAAGTEGAVLRNGLIEQTGSLNDILFSPKNRFMASFTGMRNIYPVEFSGSEAELGGLKVKHTGERTGHGFLAVPPEVIVVSLTETVTSERNRFAGRVKAVERKGTNWDVTVEVSGVEFIAAVTTGALSEIAVSPGSLVHISFKASAVHLF